MSRAPAQVILREGKILTQEELETLNSNRGISAPQIKSIRQTHRRLAQLLAMGTSDGVAASLVGLHPSRVSILKSDPAFSALMQTFQTVKDGQVFDLLEKLSEVSMNALDELRDRLLEEPEKVSNNQLLEIITNGLDRLGHSPTHKVAIATVDINELKKNASAARSDQISFRNHQTIETMAED